MTGRPPAFAVLTPVLGRPSRARPLADSLTRSGADARIVFLCSPEDREQVAACRATGCETVVVGWEAGRADFARKINHGVQATGEPFLLAAADDVRFHPGWDDVLLDGFADDQVGVCGTNDLANAEVKAGRFSTHPAVRRDYADEHGTIDGTGVALCELYDHNFCDRELAETAMYRGAWLFAADAVVEHVHPHFRPADVDVDATYRKGQQRFREDRRLFLRRRRLWGGRPSLTWHPVRAGMKAAL